MRGGLLALTTFEGKLMRARAAALMRQESAHPRDELRQLRLPHSVRNASTGRNLDALRAG
jgi:hypothetical protein